MHLGSLDSEAKHGWLPGMPSTNPQTSKALMIQLKFQIFILFNSNSKFQIKSFKYSIRFSDSQLCLCRYVNIFDAITHAHTYSLAGRQTKLLLTHMAFQYTQMYMGCILGSG